MEYVKYEKTTSVVVTDVREETEANAIRGLGGVIVHLLRDGAGLDGAEGAHSSEKGITFNVKHDIYISNNRTLADLHCEAIHLIKSIESYTAENPGSKIKNSLQQA